MPCLSCVKSGGNATLGVSQVVLKPSQRSMTYLTLVSLSPMAVPGFLDRDSGTLKDLLELPMSTIDTTRVASLCHIELTRSCSRQPPSHLPPLHDHGSDFVHCACSWQVKLVEPLCVAA